MRTVLFVSLTIMISMSGIVFAVAEGSPLAGLTLLIALGTLFFVDLEQKLATPVIAANALGLVAFFIAAAEFANQEIESRLLAGGHLIIYLTWVNLIQRKGVRQIWWLCALSILQIATASVLTEGIWFGFALLVYSFVVTWTLSVFLLYRSTLGTGEHVAEEIAGSPLNNPLGDAWKGISRDVNYGLLNLRFITVNCLITVISLLISLLFFVLIPRIWIGNYSLFGEEAISGRTLTGFTEEVRLGDMSEIMESSEPVLELRLSYQESGQPFTAEETEKYLGAEPLFRGTVMETYERGSWRQRDSGQLRPSLMTGDVAQEYVLSPIGSDVLFGFGDVVTASGRRLLYEPFSGEWKHRLREGAQPEPFVYEAFANFGPADQTGRQFRENWEIPLKAAFDVELLSPEESREVQFPPGWVAYVDRLREIPDGLERVQQLAQEIVAGSVDDAERISRLYAYLQGGDFGYTLDLSVEDASIDPLEDFLFNRRSGHCEYYASAMAMMLRCAGIPSRLISGFKGGSLEKDGSFRVKQLHAHSWVEAYVDKSWITIDPTPPLRDENVRKIESAYFGFGQIWDAMKTNWNDAVRLTQSQQERIVYFPLRQFARSAWKTIKDLLTGNTAGLRNILNVLMSPEKWFSVPGAVVASLLMLIASGVVWVSRRLLRMFQKIKDHREAERSRRIRVDFFARFISILNEIGLQPQPAQTAREFIHGSLSTIEDTLSAAGLSNCPNELVDLFYSIRFGHHVISDEETLRIDKTLSRLEECLQNREKLAT